MHNASLYRHSIGFSLYAHVSFISFEFPYGLAELIGDFLGKRWDWPTNNGIGPIYLTPSFLIIKTPENVCSLMEPEEAFARLPWRDLPSDMEHEDPLDVPEEFYGEWGAGSPHPMWCICPACRGFNSEGSSGN